MKSACLTLPPFNLKMTLGAAPVTMLCPAMDVNVEYAVRAAVPASKEGPAEPAAFTIQFVRPVRSMCMCDSADSMSLVISPNGDILAYLTTFQVAWIEEQLAAMP